jgi:hypothetical protein
VKIVGAGLVPARRVMKKKVYLDKNGGKEQALPLQLLFRRIQNCFVGCDGKLLEISS